MRTLSSFGLLLFTVPAASAQSLGNAPSQGASPMVLFPATEVEWKDGPAAMPKGAKMAVLEGDPTHPGTYTVRLRFPDGFRVPPHWHTQTEHVTVIAGVLHVG